MAMFMPKSRNDNNNKADLFRSDKKGRLLHLEGESPAPVMPSPLPLPIQSDVAVGGSPQHNQSSMDIDLSDEEFVLPQQHVDFALTLPELKANHIASFPATRAVSTRKTGKEPCCRCDYASRSGSESDLHAFVLKNQKLQTPKVNQQLLEDLPSRAGIATLATSLRMVQCSQINQ